MQRPCRGIEESAEGAGVVVVLDIRKSPSSSATGWLVGRVLEPCFAHAPRKGDAQRDANGECKRFKDGEGSSSSSLSYCPVLPRSNKTGLRRGDGDSCNGESPKERSGGDLTRLIGMEAVGDGLFSRPRSFSLPPLGGRKEM